MSDPRPDDLRAAERYLEGQGYRIVARGYSVNERWGRLDFVARDGPVLAFVKVKRGNPGRAGMAAERDGAVRTAAWFLGERGWWHFICRFDLVFLAEDCVVLEKDVR